METPLRPVLAVSNKLFSSVQQLIDYCGENSWSGIEYTLNSDARRVSALQGESSQIEKIAAAGLEIRYHFQFFSLEIALADREKARRAMLFHQDCLDLISQGRDQYATMHIGLNGAFIDHLDYGTALDHLTELVARGHEKRITLCLENLTRGWTSNPHSFLEMVEKSGAGITLDIGHVRACSGVRTSQGTATEFLRLIAPHIINARVYEIEKVDHRTGHPYHVAPQNLDVIRPLLLELIRTRCDWWLIELTSLEEVKHAQALLRSFLEEESLLNPDSTIS